MDRRLSTAFFGGIAVWALIFAASLKVGLRGFSSSDVLFQLRLPRAILATAVGVGLSVAGAVLQAIFSNPLCEPYTLGVSSGAALGAVLGAWMGLPLIALGLTGSAFFGAIAFVLVLYAVSFDAGRAGRSSALGSGGSSLLLTGVMLGFFGSSLVAVVVALSDPAGIQGALFWLLGDLSRARISGSLLCLFGVSVLAVFILFRWRVLDAFLVGDENARALGVTVDRERKILLLASSLVVGLCVSGAGMVGFVGLVVPHFARRAVGSLHLRLLPVCIAWGAAALVAADLLARLTARPYEFPVGVITALVGAPLFIAILVRKKGSSA